MFLEFFDVKKRKDTEMKFIDKIEKFDVEAKRAEVNYRAFGTTREAHQERMLAFINKKLEEAKGERKK